MLGFLANIAVYLYRAVCILYTWIRYLFLGAETAHPMSPMGSLLDDLLKSATIDYTNTEIKDIVSAVEELVKRYVDHFNKNSRMFGIIRIQPCGSMAEKTSLWKSCTVFAETIKEHKINYMEFDFLMVLNKPWDCKFKKGCSVCVDLETSPKLYDTGLEEWEDKYNWMRFDAVFHTEFNSIIATMCDCYKVTDDCISTYPREAHDDHRHHYIFREKMQRNKVTCYKCTVYRKTGMLHIATSVEADDLGRASGGQDCSFRLVWISSAKSVLATNCKTLRKSEPIHLLHISVDGLPVFEISKSDQSRLSVKADFVVPKVCMTCGLYQSAWRASNCLKEIEIAKFKSNEGHRKCYRVLKCIFAQVKLYELGIYPNGYCVKTAMLTHCKTCPSRDDYSKCVLDVLKYLQSRFQRYNWHMPSAIDGTDIIGWERPDSLWDSTECLNGIVKSFTDVQTELILNTDELTCPLTPEMFMTRMKRTIKKELEDIPEFER